MLIFQKWISSVLDTPFLSSKKKCQKIETKRHQKKSLQKMTTVLSQYYSSTVTRVSYQGYFYLWTLNLKVFSTLNRGTDASFRKIKTFDRELEFKLEKYWLKLCVANGDKVPKTARTLFAIIKTIKCLIIYVNLNIRI